MSKKSLLQTAVVAKHHARQMGVSNIKIFFFFSIRVNLVYSCRVLTLVRKQNHPHYIGLTEHALKERLDKLNNSFKYESKGNLTEPSNLVWDKKKEKVNVNLDWSILYKAKPYSPTSKKYMLCLTEKYYIIFSTKNLRIY